MKQYFVKWLVVVIVIFLILGTAGYFLFKNKSIFNLSPLVRAQSYTFGKLEFSRGLLTGFSDSRHLADEYRNLKSENEKLLSQLARLDSLESENAFLRKSLGLSVTKNRELLTGSVYSLSLGPNGYNLLLNRGSNHGVGADDIIITEDGNLVGQVKKLGQFFSNILYVADPNFKINAKILGSSTVGIARGDLGGQMALDLIVQNDEIKEGDIVISNGDDLFIAGLVIGRVSHLDYSEGQVFKKVTIEPSINGDNLGKVIILKQ